MVKITENGFTVEFASRQPATDYTEVLREMLDVVQNTDTDLRGSDNYFYLLEFVKNMLPNADQATAMFELCDEDED